jgi:hypothetical protein
MLFVSFHAMSLSVVLCSTKSIYLFIYYLACNRLLPEVIQYGEASAEYLSLFKNLIGDTQSRYYLAVKGVPLSIGQLIMQVTDKISQHYPGLYSLVLYGVVAV